MIQALTVYGPASAASVWWWWATRSDLRRSGQLGGAHRRGARR